MNFEQNNHQPQNGSTSAPQDQKPSRTEFFQGLRIYAFAGTMLLLFVVGLLLFLRPTTSESEKRELTKFPSFSVDSLISGEYFNQINTWYADTYPGREGLIGINNAIRELFGIRTVQLVQSKPDLPDDTPNEPSDPSTPSKPDVPVDTTPIERLGSVYVKGNTAYEVYTENKSNSRRYAELIARAAEQLGSGVKVYDIIVPLSSSIHLSAKELGQIGASDSKAAIDAMYAGMSGVVTVDAYSILREHNDEYLYFRTDHHWTARGAYYAYTAYCKAAGMEPLPLSTWQKYEFEGFLGTLYNEADQPAALKSNPDTVEAWVPNGTNDVRITDRSGASLKYRGGLVRTDTDSFYSNPSSKYNCFIMGDNPLTEIHNETKSDGSSIVVVKESFGNAFVPFLVDHYEYVYVVDYRYFKSATGKTLADFVNEKGCSTVLFINNLTATSATARISDMERFLGE